MKTAQLVLLLGAAISVSVAGYLAAAGSIGSANLAAIRVGGFTAAGADAPETTVAQADEEVPPNEIDKYVAVYKAMQHDHRLSVEQAAAAQGLTLREFRDLEQRIEHNDVARDDARRALAESAQQSAPSSSRASPSTPQP